MQSACALLSCGLSEFTIFFLLYLINGKFFKTKLLIILKKCDLIFSTTFFVCKMFILRRTGRGAIKIYIGLLVQYPLFLSDFNEF